MYGKLRVAVGGQPIEADGKEAEPEYEQAVDDLIPPTAEGKKLEAHAAENVEPVFYTSYAPEYYEERINLINMSDLIHFTSSDGAAAKARMTQKVGYYVSCMVDEHKTI